MKTNIYMYVKIMSLKQRLNAKSNEEGKTGTDGRWYTSHKHTVKRKGEDRYRGK